MTIRSSFYTRSGITAEPRQGHCSVVSAGGLPGTGEILARAADHFGDRQARQWRRDVDARPPPVSPLDPRHPSRDGRYRAVPPGLLPPSESLRDVIARVLAVWHDRVTAHLLQNRTVLVVAHTNCIRSLVHHLEKVATVALVDLAIPAATPFVYRFEVDPCRPASQVALGETASAGLSWAE